MAVNKRPKILVVDDEVGIRELLMEILSDEGYSVVVAENAEAAWEARLREPMSLVLLDIWMPGKDGLTLLKQWTDAGLADLPIIVMSGHATIDTAVEAVKLGALEVLEKPIATNRLLVSLQNALSTGRSEKGNPDIIRTNFGKAHVLQQFKKQLLEASASQRPALFVGTPNAGVLFFAQMLVPSKTKVVFLDRGDQLEGSTDTILRDAAGGLIVARLIDLLTPVQQSGLLALVREAGRVEARLAAGSIENPEVLEKDKGFNKTLLDAFSNHVISLPSLPQYIEDIPYIVDIITRRLTDNTDMAGRQLTPEAVNLLTQHHYENDFMELLSLIRSALIYTSGSKVDATTVKIMMEQYAINSSLKGVSSDIFSMPLREARNCFEREYFRRIMQVARGNIQHAAQISGLERTYLYRKLKYHKED